MTKQERTTKPAGIRIDEDLFGIRIRYGEYSLFVWHADVSTLVRQLRAHCEKDEDLFPETSAEVNNGR